MSTIGDAQSLMKNLERRMRRDLKIDVTALADFTDEQLLAELVRRHKVQVAPNSVKLLTPHSVVAVGIGKDHTATVVVDDESLEELKKHELS